MVSYSFIFHTDQGTILFPPKKVWLLGHKLLQNPEPQRVKAAPNHLSRWLTAEWLLTVAGSQVGEGLRKERQGKEWKGSQQLANQPARILGYKQPQMLNFRHIQCRVVERGGEAVRSWGSRTRTRNRSKTDSRRQPQANCWQGRSEGSCRGWKEVVCGLSRFLVFLGFRGLLDLLAGPCASQRANQTVVPVWDVLGRSTRRPGTQNPRMPHVRCQILGSLIDGCCWRLFVFVRAAESRKLGEQPQEQQSYDIFSIEIIIIYYY